MNRYVSSVTEEPEESLASAEAVGKLSKDLLASIKNNTLVLTKRDIRFVVDLFYQTQDFRKASANQERSAGDEPCELVGWYKDQMRIIESQIQRALDAWTDTDLASVWAKSILGIGPILSAGLAANIDMSVATNPSKIWRFAGLDPSVKWVGRAGARKVVDDLTSSKMYKKPADAIDAAAKAVNFSRESVQKFALLYGDGKITWESLGKALTRCPWNARLKVLCWKIGDSFVKVSGNPRSYYGRIYRERKALEVERSETGQFSEVAAQALSEKKFRSDSGAAAHYKAGKLPPGRLDLRARRKAVKMFLSHWWEVAYRDHYKKDPPVPYAIAVLGHADLVTAEQVLSFEMAKSK